MKVIKRSGKEVNYDKVKITNAILNANFSVDEKKHRLSEKQIASITDRVVDTCSSLGRAVHVEEIQDMVEVEIMRAGAYMVAKNYITYRYKHDLLRKSNTTDAQILSLIECANEEITQENSNKNPTVNSVQRD